MVHIGKVLHAKSYKIHFNNYLWLKRNTKARGVRIKVQQEKDKGGQPSLLALPFGLMLPYRATSPGAETLKFSKGCNNISSKTPQSEWYINKLRKPQ
jgi:hypothetical protein